MELDAGHLRTTPDSLHVDVMDLVVLDPAEGAAETADDAGLPAVVDVVVAHEMAADLLLGPTVFLERVING